MGQLVALILSGLVVGAIYGTLALAMVIIHRGTSVANFAQGEMATLSTFVGWTLLAVGVPLWLTAIIVLAFGFLLGAVLERGIMRPFERKDHLVTVIVSLGIFGAISGLTQYTWGGDVKTFPSFFPAGAIKLGGVSLDYTYLGTLLVLGLLVLAVWFLFSKTHFGRVLRAAARNPQSATLVGINVSRTYMAAWAIAGVIGAIAGMLVAPILLLEPHMMAGILVYAFAGAVLGGFESAFGAVVGGLVIGVAENLLATYVPWIGNDLKLPVVIVGLMLVLLVRPQGLFGTRQIERV